MKQTNSGQIEVVRSVASAHSTWHADVVHSFADRMGRYLTTKYTFGSAVELL